MSDKSIKETESMPEELHDSDLDQAAGGYTKVEWTYAKSESAGSVDRDGSGEKIT